MKASRSAHFHAAEPHSAQAAGRPNRSRKGNGCFPRRCCALRDNAHAPADLGRAAHRACQRIAGLTPLSVLEAVGRGASKTSEIAARLGTAQTNLGRTLQQGLDASLLYGIC